ncbi:MAG TPA: hypothetical protein VE870_13365, partial [Bacteroidales bacterium]|nr:hypothetical protein [Bacteroidales bacterium]
VVYNWGKLDQVMDKLLENGLKPIFEIMGYPSSSWEVSEQVFDNAFQGQKSDANRYFTDFENPVQIKQFRDLVKSMALHFIDRYGKQEVRSWYFETTNEPNLKNFWPFGLQGFLNYYDACSEGLKDADPALRFGGPGTAGAPNNAYFKALLEHCSSGMNYFTGENGVRIDFISYHLKNRARYMIGEEQGVYDFIVENYPALMNIPLINDEADPIAGWSKKYWWRPGPWYASFVVHSIDLHDRYLIGRNDLSYALLSNDNGFMGDWYRRTHFARFTRNNDDQLSNSHGFYLVKKPVYTVMSLLALLGDKRYPVTLDNLDKNYGVIPTEDSLGNYIIAIYNSPTIEISYQAPESTEMEYADSTIFRCQETSMKISLAGLKKGQYKLIHYRIDEKHGNPFDIWKKNGRPGLPSTEVYRKMIAVQEPALMGSPSDVTVNSNIIELEVDMPSPSVSFLVLARKTETVPAAPYGLSFDEYNGLNHDKMVYVSWKDSLNTNVLSYELMCKTDSDTAFSRVNAQYQRDRGYSYILPENVKRVEYRIKTIDYWGRESVLSEPLILSY